MVGRTHRQDSVVQAGGEGGVSIGTVADEGVKATGLFCLFGCVFGCMFGCMVSEGGKGMAGRYNRPTKSPTFTQRASVCQLKLPSSHIIDGQTGQRDAKTV